MSSHKISVIIPVYNAEKYLSHCIKSILSQTFTDFEVLLIDDGSTDGSGEICDEFAKNDTRIRVFHKNNGGVSSARNVGLDNAKGEWITFCDADDWVGKDWLFNFSEGFDYDIVVQGFYITKVGNDVECMMSTLHDAYYKRTDIRECLVTLSSINNVGYLWCRAFRREIIDHFCIRFNENYALCEDLDFVFKYLLVSETSFIKASACYHYAEPFFKDKYEREQFSYKSLKCFYGILNNYISLVGNDVDALGISFINHYTNCLIHIVRNGDMNNEEFNSYIKFIHSFVHNSHCWGRLSVKTKVFLTISRLKCAGIGKKLNTVLWKVVRKYR